MESTAGRTYLKKHTKKKSLFGRDLMNTNILTDIYLEEYNDRNDTAYTYTELYGIIYVAFNILTGKRYVGQTKYLLNRRINSHYSDSRNIKTTKLFAKALQKYRKNSFDWEIKDVAISQEELNEKEKLWIKL